jgi:hypothetical protein
LPEVTEVNVSLWASEQILAHSVAFTVYLLVSSTQLFHQEICH